MQSIYESKKWKKIRAKILRRDAYMCQHFKRYGQRIDANMVHHIYPADEYPQYAWCDWNLISLSNKAHDMMHDRITNKLTKLGEDLKRRIPRPPSTKN